jgi:hypothetical protein
MRRNCMLIFGILGSNKPPGFAVIVPPPELDDADPISA